MSELSNHQQSQPGTPTRRPESSQAANPVSRTPENAENALRSAKQRARESDATAAAAVAELEAEKARNKQLEERVRALELEKAQLKAANENGGGKIEDVYHVNGSSDHQIATKTCKGWVKFWQETTALPLPKYCPCQKSDGVNVQHELDKSSNNSPVGAHVKFRTADGQNKVGIVPVCLGCNSGGGKPINFECLAVTVFDVGAQTYVGDIKGKSIDNDGKESTNIIKKFDRLEVSLQNKNSSTIVAGTGSERLGKVPRPQITSTKERKRDDLYNAHLALAAMGGLANNHHKLKQHPHEAKVYLLNEGRGHTMYDEAWVLTKGEDYESAVNLFRKVIKFDPTNAMAHNSLGHLLDEVHQKYNAAAKHYRKAIELDPSCASAHNNLGEVLRTVRRDYDGAETHYRKAIEVDPKQAHARWNLSLILENQKNDIPGAIRLVEEFVHLGGVAGNDGKERLAILQLSTEAESPAPAKDTEPENSDGGHPETKV